ncbi:hypothetical protein ISU10_21980 [Nocardioides agariphilus]|uniref:Uncharacterized protein n=1 Tax=Nocardioides agariphilus TaxID=433664 RepID=A0A930VT39_9ACTN|nr:hypothetical protein [Nocardioides agariphilus]MBF4770451.1 hypothetical protein [Nocardioides agariphilus]
MRARVLGVLLLATLVGVGGGLGVGYLRQPQPASGGTATPLPAASPSLPIDPPTSQAPYAVDIDYPPLLPGLVFKTVRMANSQQTWLVPVPIGWQGFNVDTDELVPRKDWPTYDELRFRPEGEPVEGGYSLRVKLVNSRVTPAQMVADKRDGLAEVDDVQYLDRTTEALKFTYRTAANRLRYNYFQWFAAPQSDQATLEMSVVGRTADVEGLDALFAAFESTLEAVE